MRCPHCQHENREGARFCGACGASLGGGIACSRCAALNPLGQTFCDSCGASLSPSVRAPAPARDARAYTPRHLVEKILTTRGALEGAITATRRVHRSTPCYPQFAEFLRLKRVYDPEERFQSDWYRHYRKMYG